MNVTGHFRKMRTEYGQPVQYLLPLDEETVDMNDLIGHHLKLRFTGDIHCKVCGRKTKKSFGQGFCYPDFINHPANSECIIRPELCEGHLGKGRDPEWEKEHHVQPHVVYLALSSGVKVGVTRQDQVPTRWIDQGAWKAIRLAEVPYRRLAGEIEVALKEHLTDKTPWQRMLKHELATGVDLQQYKEEMRGKLPEAFQEYYSDNHDIIEIEYPALGFPEKVKSLSFDKQPEIEGKLMGIKGQYLLFEEGRVLNVRKHTSYLVELSA